MYNGKYVQNIYCIFLYFHIHNKYTLCTYIYNVNKKNIILDAINCLTTPI